MAAGSYLTYDALFTRKNLLGRAQLADGTSTCGCYADLMIGSAEATLRAEASRLIAPKFEAYFSFTGALCRSVPIPQGGYVYPDASMIADLNFLWLVFADVCQIADEKGKRWEELLASLVDSESFLKRQFCRILEGDSKHPDGEFWHAPAGQLRLVHRTEALNKRLKDVLKTLRNGFAHTHWLYHDLSAPDYWKERGWNTAKAPADFKLQDRPKKNYLTYIADALPPFNPDSFWELKDLRILITPAAVLRYHLHLFLAFLLTEKKVDLFGSPVTS